jgi:hypothetical protein
MANHSHPLGRWIVDELDLIALADANAIRRIQLATDDPVAARALGDGAAAVHSLTVEIAPDGSRRVVAGGEAGAASFDFLADLAIC